MRFRLIGLLASGVLPSLAIAATPCTAQSPARTTPLVELYTSEGCSSCPPADRWFSSHIHDAGASWLAFHVDYWDTPEWRDRFDSPRYASRQSERVHATGQSAIYTPQVMVGRDVQAPWHDDASMQALLQRARQPAPVLLTLKLSPVGSGWRIDLAAVPTEAPARAGAQLWLAQTSDGLTTRVEGGENGGVTLHHDRVVRHLLGPWTLRPRGVHEVFNLKVVAPHSGLTAFVQDAKGAVWQSLQLDAGRCNK